MNNSFLTTSSSYNLKDFDKSIIFEDDYFIAINKPSGLLTIPDRYDDTQNSLYKILQKHYEKIYIIHRLDKETSGIILFAKDELTHKYLSQLFEQRNIQKFYLGIVIGSLPEKCGKIEEPIIEHPFQKGKMLVNKNGKPAHTDFEVLEDYKFYSLVKFKIHTGRTHQIRVHMKHIGHPLACDDLYGNGEAVKLSNFKKKYKLSKNEEEEKPLISRLALHSNELKFTGIRGMEHDLIADLPKDMKALLQQLKKTIYIKDFLLFI